MRLEIAQAHHARIIAATMRSRDVAEVMQGWQKDPEEAICEALEASYFARTMFLDLEPICIYGLAPLLLLSGTARFWIFGTEAIDRHKVAFARACRRFYPEIFMHCSIATNLIDVNDAPAIRWMRWLGGVSLSPIMARGSMQFKQFILRCENRGMGKCLRA